MAPEQLERQPATALSDQYSFAVSLFEAVFDAAPFPGANVGAVLDAVRAGRIVFPAQASPPGWLRRILIRALAAAPERRFPSMEAMLDALERGRRRLARVAVIGGVIALVAATATVATLLGSSTHLGLDCDPAAEQIASVFSPVDQLRLASNMTLLRPAFGDTTARRVTQKLDSYGKQLTAARVAACRATENADAATRAVDPRTVCLEDVVRSYASITRSLVAPANGGAVNQADRTLEGLLSIDDCDRNGVAMMPRLTPEKKAEHDRLDGVFQDLRIRAKLGDYTAALAAVRPLIEEARKFGYPPLLAKVLDLAGRLEFQLGDKGAEAHLREAAEVAAGARDDHAAVQAWTALLALAGTFPDRPDRFETTLVAARAAAARTGDPADRAYLDLVEGQALVHAGKYPESEQACRRALAVVEQLHGVGSLDVREAVACIGKALEERSAYADARPWLERALKLDETILGSDHPDTAEDAQTLGELELRVGRFPEGLAQAKRALAILERALGATPTGSRRRTRRSATSSWTPAATRTRCPTSCARSRSPRRITGSTATRRPRRSPRWAVCTTTWAGMPRRARCSSARLPCTRRAVARIIPISRSR